MKILNVANYPNLLEQIPLSSQQILDMVSNYSLSFLRVRNHEVEWGIRFPMFVESFYHTICTEAKVPNQQEAFDEYLNYNRDFFEKLNRPDLMTALKARYFRVYPSLVRDVYFNKYIYERLSDKCEIIYNISLDVEEGIDLLIFTQKAKYGMCFFIETKRGNFGRVVKQYRHTPFDDVQYVEMPMAFEGSVKAGDFFLYGEREYNEMINLLSK